MGEQMWAAASEVFIDTYGLQTVWLTSVISPGQEDVTMAAVQN